MKRLLPSKMSLNLNGDTYSENTKIYLKPGIFRRNDIEKLAILISKKEFIIW